jgi:hypothetical protein
MAIHVPPPDAPFPTFWTDLDRGNSETALDCETAVSLACHLTVVFDEATDWPDLIAALDARGFGLQFQGTRLVLLNEQTGVTLCTCRVLGHGFAALSARFGKPRVLAVSGRLVTPPN